MTLFAIPFVLQGFAIVVDEFVFHRARGLPKWERIGHPLDTLTVVACFLYVLFVPYSPSTAVGYVSLSIFSCLFITKDEWVHTEHCRPLETWLHSVLFILHPVVLGLAGALWALRHKPALSDVLEIRAEDLGRMWDFLSVQTAIVIAFLIYQIIYWNFICKPKHP